ncbi:MAG TPA: histidine kinase [Chthoniobacterales bacterium]|nr:histidine kinase [Chthoniobacterales bacterium]
MIRSHSFLLANALSNDSSIVERCFNFGVGTALATLLLILAVRSTGENRLARLGFAVCALIFTLGACVMQIAFGLGQSGGSLVVVLAGDLAFCAAVTWPVTILGLWAQGTYSSHWREQFGRLVLAAAGLSAVLLSVVHVAGLLPERVYNPLGMENPIEKLSLAAYNGLFFLWFGALVFLPGRLRGRLSWISVTALLAGISLSTLRALEEHFISLPAWLHSVILVTKPFTILFVVAGGLFGFSHFRFSDIFAQKGLRILLGALLALVSSFLARAIFGSLASGSDHSQGLATLGFAVLMWIGIVCYAKITMLSDWLVDRQIFRQADYQRALKSFREAIAAQSEPMAIFNTGEELAKGVLRIADATVRTSDTPKLGGVSCSSAVRECIFPIQKGEDLAPFSLEISPGPGRHTLFNAEIDFLREVCLAIGRRLEAIDREKENIERARREAQLVKQLVEAELRALRAQIHPHFLFNSLNSVAALIAADPRAAEEMIIRLAKIFRHVLTYTDRPFSSIREEISFLETYLEIEKVRFGDRLQVNFDIQESVTQLSVPTLILQPLVENSIKHGLGPKVGENQLTIRARQKSDYLELTVEDNGVGANVATKPSSRSTGLGLRNVEERLQTLYRGSARFFFESEPRTGSRALILIPIPALHEKTALAAH